MQADNVSMSWQHESFEAKRRRGFSDIPIKLSQHERWVLDQAYGITGIAPGQFLKLAFIEPNFNLDVLERDIAPLEYKLQEARRCDLKALEQAENGVQSYAKDISARLAKQHQSTTSQWSPL